MADLDITHSQTVTVHIHAMFSVFIFTLPLTYKVNQQEITFFGSRMGVRDLWVQQKVLLQQG